MRAGRLASQCRQRVRERLMPAAQRTAVKEEPLGTLSTGSTMANPRQQQQQPQLLPQRHFTHQQLADMAQPPVVERLSSSRKEGHARQDAPHNLNSHTDATYARSLAGVAQRGVLQQRQQSVQSGGSAVVIPQKTVAPLAAKGQQARSGTTTRPALAASNLNLHPTQSPPVVKQACPVCPARWND